MSDTPETDTELNYGAFGFYTMGGLPAFAVGAEFARELERERDAVEQEVADVRDVLLDALPHIGGSTKKLAELLAEERDSNQRQADALVDQLGAVQERMIDAERERDASIKSQKDSASYLLNQLTNADRCIEKITAYIEEIKSERDDLREIFPKILEALESGSCAATCSVDFLREIPREVKLVRQRLERERDLWKLEAEQRQQI